MKSKAVERREAYRKIALWLERRVKGEKGAVVALRPTRIAEETGVSPRHVAHILRRLREAGLIEKVSWTTYIFNRADAGKIIKALKEAA